MQMKFNDKLAGVTTCGNRELNPGSRCFVEDKRTLCQLSSKR